MPLLGAIKEALKTVEDSAAGLPSDPVERAARRIPGPGVAGRCSVGTSSTPTSRRWPSFVNAGSSGSMTSPPRQMTLSLPMRADTRRTIGPRDIRVFACAYCHTPGPYPRHPDSRPVDRRMVKGIAHVPSRWSPPAGRAILQGRLGHHLPEPLGPPPGPPRPPRRHGYRALGLGPRRAALDPPLPWGHRVQLDPLTRHRLAPPPAGSNGSAGGGT